MILYTHSDSDEIPVLYKGNIAASGAYIVWDTVLKSASLWTWVQRCLKPKPTAAQSVMYDM